jgi:putative transcriptional regulator
MTGPSAKGRLLLATPPLVDPNFDRTVVLVLEHNDEGALGLVLNRPTPEDEVPGLAPWFGVATDPAVVFQGGPVESDTLIGLAAADPIDRARADDDGGNDGWAPLATGLGTVDLEVDPEDVSLHYGGFRLFRGYAGWGPGQLDDELAQGAWIVVDGIRTDPFTTDPDDLWRAVLRRQGGRLAWLANCPDDLSLN